MIYRFIVSTLIFLSFGLGFFWGKREGDLSTQLEKENASPVTEEEDTTDPHQEELRQFVSQIRESIEAEMELNLEIFTQLHTYKQIFHHLTNYSKEIEREIDLLQEISRDEFQENVRLQAALFKGKKPELIVNHLRELSPTRAGAILAKMKEKKVSNILDLLADVPEKSFYREVLHAYLKSKRRTLHPELFQKVANQSEEER